MCQFIECLKICTVCISAQCPLSARQVNGLLRDRLFSFPSLISAYFDAVLLQYVNIP